MTYIFDLLFNILSEALGSFFESLLTSPVTIFTQVMIALLSPAA